MESKPKLSLPFKVGSLCLPIQKYRIMEDLSKIKAIDACVEKDD